MVKSLGGTLIADHTTLDSAVEQTAQALGVTLPATPDARQQTAAATLQQASMDTFDSLFVVTELDGQHTAMAATRAELATGTDPQVEAVARTAAPVIASHELMLESAGTELDRPLPQHS
jgi:putative membrane protein